MPEPAHPSVPNDLTLAGLTPVPRESLNSILATPNRVASETSTSGGQSFAKTTVGHDIERYKEIVRGQIRKDLGKLIGGGALPHIDTPRFIYGKPGSGALGSGDAKPGDILGPPSPGQGKQAGNSPGEHALAQDFIIPEIMKAIDDQLELPDLTKQSDGAMQQAGNRYSSISPKGSKGLRHLKRTYVRGLAREQSEGTFAPGKAPSIIPRDELFKAPRPILIPKATATIFYMLDISGSMEDEQKQIARIEAAWLNKWLDRKYEKVNHHYVVHDSDAREVNYDTFHRLREAGGTCISSCYKLVRSLMEKYPKEQCNFYGVQFSDGDNSSLDNDTACKILGEDLLPYMSLFGYCQVESESGSGKFMRELKEHKLTKLENLKISELIGRDDIWPSILTMFGKKAAA